MSTLEIEPVANYAGRNNETVRIATLPLALIEMPTYQRDRKLNFITKLAGEWDETAYAFPIVAAWHDRFLCIDGQQRLCAAEGKNKEAVTVLLYEGIKNQERLADLFLKINRDRKLLDAFEKYIGAIAAKDKGTLEIERIVGEFDLRVSKSAAASGKVPAGAVTKIHQQGGSELLHRTLMVREMAWAAQGGKEANESATLQGLANFLRKYWDKVDDDRLVTILRRYHPNYILQAINRHRGERLSYSDYIKEHYNKGLRGSKKL